jgi:hypothetical protein
VWRSTCMETAFGSQCWAVASCDLEVFGEASFDGVAAEQPAGARGEQRIGGLAVALAGPSASLSRSTISRMDNQRAIVRLTHPPSMATANESFSRLRELEARLNNEATLCRDVFLRTEPRRDILACPGRGASGRIVR